ncbi:hypothetical protein Y09_2265 [Brachybacterium sp. SW0106-09]|nr:hypothetical protein Y09_2265 [Brachybacterium sp. SW0106-09]
MALPLPRCSVAVGRLPPSARRSPRMRSAMLAQAPPPPGHASA